MCIYINVHTYVYIFFFLSIFTKIYNRNSIGYIIINKLYSVEYSFLCCIKGPCYLSILYVIVCITNPKLPIHPSPIPPQF